MPQKITKVGKWSVGDLVLKRHPKEYELFQWEHRNTPEGYVIVSFSDDKKQVHLRHNVYDILDWKPVEEITEFEREDWYTGDAPAIPKKLNLRIVSMPIGASFDVPGQWAEMKFKQGAVISMHINFFSMIELNNSGGASVTHELRTEPMDYLKANGWDTERMVD